jgi:hypothetical protein
VRLQYVSPGCSRRSSFEADLGRKDITLCDDCQIVMGFGRSPDEPNLLRARKLSYVRHISSYSDIVGTTEMNKVQPERSLSRFY